MAVRPLEQQGRPQAWTLSTSGPWRGHEDDHGFQKALQQCGAEL